MALKFYDASKVAYGTDPLESFHDGYKGGVYEQKIYIRNDDNTKWYTNLTLGVKATGFEDEGEFGVTGWGMKFITGERQPTEAEWDVVTSNSTVALADIGTTSAGDDTTYLPVWVRIYCPGGSPAQIRDNSIIELKAFDRPVGS